MKWYLFIGAGIVLMITAVLLLILPNSTPQVVDQTQVTLPSAGSTNPHMTVTSGPQGGSTILVGSQASSNGLPTLDFINNGVTTQDPQNPDQYYLAGKIGYCLENGSCPSGAPSDEYHVVYMSKDKSFIIALLKEPLSLARSNAEKFLMKTLGLGGAEMCALKYYISTDAYTNEQYAGKNLLFSFCPGATQLPQ